MVGKVLPRNTTRRRIHNNSLAGRTVHLQQCYKVSSCTAGRIQWGRKDMGRKNRAGRQARHTGMSIGAGGRQVGAKVVPPQGCGGYASSSRLCWAGRGWSN